MTQVSFKCGDITATAIVPGHSVPAMLYKYSDITDDPNLITVLDFINHKDINKVDDIQLLIENIIYYDVMDLEDLIDDIMYNRDLNGSFPYGQELYKYLFENGDCINTYYISKDDLWDWVIIGRNYPSEIYKSGINYKLDNNLLTVGEYEDFYEILDYHDMICITDNPDSYPYDDILTFKIGEYYLHISKNFKKSETYGYGMSLDIPKNPYKMIDIYCKESKQYKFDLKNYEVVALNNILCGDGCLYYKFNDEYHITDIDLYILEIMIMMTENLEEIYYEYI